MAKAHAKCCAPCKAFFEYTDESSFCNVQGDVALGHVSLHGAQNAVNTMKIALIFLTPTDVNGSETPRPSINGGPCSWQDDFALVLMEDANGESISLTEGLPSEKQFKAPILFSE